MNFVHEMEAENNRMAKDQGGVEVANQAARQMMRVPSNLGSRCTAR